MMWIFIFIIIPRPNFWIWVKVLTLSTCKQLFIFLQHFYLKKHTEISSFHVTDSNYFACRSSDVATRKKYVNLVDSVKDSGGTAHIFSSMHVSGERECNLFVVCYMCWSNLFGLELPKFLFKPHHLSQICSFFLKSSLLSNIWTPPPSKMAT